jgi:hypothetical protein
MRSKSITWSIPWATLLSACVGNPPAKPLQLVVDTQGEGGCVVRFQGEQLVTDQLYERLRVLPHGQEIEVKGGYSNVPYRCIGGAIFAIQRAKLKPKFEFAAEPPLPDRDQRP